MAVERVDYSSDEEFLQAQQQEEWEMMKLQDDKMSEEQCRAEMMQEPPLVSMEEKFNALTKELKEMSGQEQNYQRLWGERADLSREIAAIKKNRIRINDLPF